MVSVLKHFDFAKHKDKRNTSFGLLIHDSSPIHDLTRPVISEVLNITFEGGVGDVYSGPLHVGFDSCHCWLVVVGCCSSIWIIGEHCYCGHRFFSSIVWLVNHFRSKFDSWPNRRILSWSIHFFFLALLKPLSTGSIFRSFQHFKSCLH